MDIKKIKQLIELMKETEIQELEVTEGEESIRINRGSVNGSYVPAAVTAQSVEQEVVQEDMVEKKQKLVGFVERAPMVGTFYRAASPSSPPYVEVGNKVKEGDIVCIIESMKMMNHIKASKGGVVEAILVDNEKAVEYDQPLFTIV